MAEYSSKIKEYCKANNVNSVNFRSDVLLQDDGDGVVYIHEWNLDIPQPTSEQVESYETVANETEANAVDLKASAKAKLIAGEALTEDEANTIVL
jgi:hypothetical protein